MLKSILRFTILLAAMVSSSSSAQAPRLPTPSSFPRDSVRPQMLRDSLSVSLFHVPNLVAQQDTARQCRSTAGYVWFGAFIGLLVGSARYEKGLDSSGADFAPWLSIPFVVGPFVLGGMLLGHLIAPC